MARECERFESPGTNLGFDFHCVKRQPFFGRQMAYYLVNSSDSFVNSERGDLGGRACGRSKDHVDLAYVGGGTEAAGASFGYHSRLQQLRLVATCTPCGEDTSCKGRVDRTTSDSLRSSQICSSCRKAGRWCLT
jgi:hypothetical protein